MKVFKIFIAALFLGLTLPMYAQEPQEVRTESSEEPAPTEEQTPEEFFDDPNDTVPPVDDILERKLINEKLVLDYEPMREADLFWSKRIWRELDVREKMNQRFMYTEAPFFKVLTEAISKGQIRAYADEKFKTRLKIDEISQKLFSIDTTPIVNTETYEEELKITRNDIDYTSIRKFRIKEVWYFDAESSTLKCRILGIAPIQDKEDDQGNLKYSAPMFWIYYPNCRKVFAKTRVFNEGNDASPLTWDDIFEMRFFSSYIYQESNVQGMRLHDYASFKDNGVDRLLESQKIKETLFNFEHDLWSY
jgi:gliding motility associated protien GldN